MNAGELDIQIDQGADFILAFELEDSDGEPVSLSGATISGKIRLAPESAAAIVSFTGTINDGPNGEGQVSLTAAQTAAIDVDDSGTGKRKLKKFVYDIEVLYSDGLKQRILQGLCLVSPEASY